MASLLSPTNVRLSTAALWVLALGASCAWPKTDLIPESFNKGAIDTSAGDPFQDPAKLREDHVFRIVKDEMLDGYFGQGAAPPSEIEHDVASWMRAAAGNSPKFLQGVREFACVDSHNTNGACHAQSTEPASAAEVSESEADPDHDSPTQEMVDVRARVKALHRNWCAAPTRPICADTGKRDPGATAHFADYVRFQMGVERATREIAALYVEGLVDDAAILRGAERAFQRAATVVGARTWRRELDARTAALVVKGGAVNGIFSAGVVWVTLHVAHEAMKLSATPEGEALGLRADHRFKLLSGTSTGAFIVAAVDLFNAAQNEEDRAAALRNVLGWFTCYGVSDFFCARSAFMGDLLASDKTALEGVLEFDGLESLLNSNLNCGMMRRGSELVLNAVDFRSGRLLSLSDQDACELGTPAHAAQAVLASAVLPIIAKPIPHLPVDPNPPEKQTYLDGGIRSELPILPLARRGAERVLVVSSSASLLGETGRLLNALDIATRYIDVSTGGVTEGEMQHAQRHAESTRYAEVLECESLLRRNGPLGALCRSGQCQRSVLCEGEFDEKRLCNRPPPTAAAPEPSAEEPNGDRRGGEASPAGRIRRLWRMQRIFRDEGAVPAGHGYSFEPKEQRRLFRAGVEAARIRCLDIASVLGIDTENAALRPLLSTWCTPPLPAESECKRDPRFKKLPSGEYRVCDAEEFKKADPVNQVCGAPCQP